MEEEKREYDLQYWRQITVAVLKKMVKDGWKGQKLILNAEDVIQLSRMIDDLGDFIDKQENK